MPLTIAPIGKEVRIVRTAADETMHRHLNSLGLIVGENITPLSDSMGNLIVRVRDSRLAIGRSLAMKIFVE